MTRTRNNPSDKGAFQAFLEDGRRLVNTELARILDHYVPAGRLQEAMRHSLNAGGKRLRPILSLAAAQAAGGRREAALPAGCALELIHTYSLIHDDLPAIDNDAMRRGKPACHTAFDEATAIFAGDALHTLAFQYLSDPDQVLPDARKQMRIIHTIARATGNQGMIEGQMKDILAQGRSLDLAALRELHSQKTGALIIAAVSCGAITATEDPNALARLETYAANIGLAFQVVDDILDIQGDPALLGKETGADERRGKATYPGLLGLAESRSLAGQLIDDSLQALATLDDKAEPLRALARYIIERDA